MTTMGAAVVNDPIPAALARLRRHGRYPELVSTAQEILDYRADLALVEAIVTVADAALRWDALRLETVALRVERGRIQCEHERNVRDADGPEVAACWKFVDVGYGETARRDESAWCGPCRKRQEIHERYVATVRRRGAALRHFRRLAQDPAP